MTTASRRDSAAIERFSREAQAASQLRHPNTTAVFDFGRTEEGLYYMVLELLRELGADVLITTHFLAFAARLSAEDAGSELTFLQVELDDRQLPTFSFVEGVASTSLATRTAARLGVTREELRALVKKRG